MLARIGYQTLGHRKESLAKQHFTHQGFEIVSAEFLCDNQGHYINGTQLRSKLYNAPGVNRTPHTDDVVYLCDTLMGIDFFLDCGHYVIGIDATLKSSRSALASKQDKATKRISLIKKHNLGLKVLNNHSHKWVIKPIQKIVIYCFNPENYDNNIDTDGLFDTLDRHTSTDIFINLN